MGTCEDRCSSIDLVNEINLEVDSKEIATHHGDCGDRVCSSEQVLIQKLEDSHIDEKGEEEKEDEKLEGEEGVSDENFGTDEEVDEEKREDDEVQEIEGMNHPYPLRSNADNCSFYMKTGACKFGFNCRFNHPVNRVVQAVDVDSNEYDTIAQGTDDNGKIECKYYSTSGGCKYGDACRFVHSNDKTDNGLVEFNFLGLPIRKGERECPYYMRNGSCGYGATCRFHHPDPTASMEETKSLVPNGGSLQGSKIFAARNITDCAPPMSSMPRSISNSSSSENMPSCMPWMNAIPQGMPQIPGYNQYQVPISLPEKTMNSRSGYSLTSPLKKADPFGFNQQAMQNEEFPERPGELDCDYFVKTGTCKFRSACRFNHPKSRTFPMPNGAIHNLSKEANHMTYPTQMVQMEEHPERPGVLECAYFMRTGECKFKSACKFHHPKSRNPKSSAGPTAAPSYGMNGLPSRAALIMPHEAKKLPDLYPSYLSQTEKPLKHQLQQPTRLEEFPDRPGQPDCEYFMKTGDCKYKFACKYHHPKNSRGQGSTASECAALNEKGLPLRPGAKTCRNYEQLGICKYGPRCLFDHPSSSNSLAIPDSPAPHSPSYNNSGAEEVWDDGWAI